MKKIVAENGKKVAVHYTGTLENGEKFDSSLDRGTPLEFTVGAGQMIPGFDAGVVGMKISDKKTLTLTPKDAYGERDDTRVQVIPVKDLVSFTNAGFELKVGEKLPTQMGEFAITANDGENVTIDVNHALAGKTLIFEVEIMDIK